ncbi:MAG: RHS repeat-associated core domain-containing protein, partial [Anaerolinea sp.]|nr:RHS repeat-associated core domain-containing protein [Anaerolinea sp.]
VDAAGQILESRLYAPYGDPFGGSGTAQTGFGFTGEVTDASGLVYLRARYYVPELGVFPSLDPVEEGNRYGYVGGNVVNRVDPSGECWLNERANNLQQDYCHTQFLRYTQDISRQYDGAWPPELHKAIGDQARFWSQLDFEDFLYLWNNPDFNPPSGGWGIAAILAHTQAATTPNPVVAFVGVCTALGVMVLLVAALPKRRGLADDIQDFLKYLTDSFGRSIPIPIPRPRDYTECHPAWNNCASLERAGGLYVGFEEAVDEICRAKQMTAYEDLQERSFTYASHCPGIGSHSHFYDTPAYDENYVASVTCCPCCNTDYGIPYPDVRCFVKYSRSE